jgi:hypothetical protein
MPAARFAGLPSFFPHEDAGASGWQKVQRFHGLSADMFALSYGK